MNYLPTNPYIRAILGGILSAILVASPIVDDGVTISECLAIGAAFITGSGLTATPSGRAVQADTVAVVGHDEPGNYVPEHRADH